MIPDSTENIRKQLVATINGNPKPREELERSFGSVWDTRELQVEFQVHAFAAPFVEVTRKADNAHGTLIFQHSPRFYFCFEASGVNND